MVSFELIGYCETSCARQAEWSGPDQKWNNFLLRFWILLPGLPNQVRQTDINKIFCISIILKVPYCQIGYAWECMVPLDKALKRTSTAIYRLFYIFDLEYLIKGQSSERFHAKMNPTFCLFGSQFACAQTAIFSAEPCSKNVGETSIVL